MGRREIASQRLAQRAQYFLLLRLNFGETRAADGHRANAAAG
jgi:hypothetical protein